MGLKCLLGHDWKNGKCTRCGKQEPKDDFYAGMVKNRSVEKQSAMWIFACYDNQRVAAMSMFGNTAQYFSEEHAINTVRGRFSIPQSTAVKFAEPTKWHAPDVVATEMSFNVDIPTVNGAISKYLQAQGYDITAISAALNKASAIPNPRLGILLFCVDLR